MLIAIILILLSYYLDVQLGFGFYTRAVLIIAIAILFYALLARIAKKLRLE